MRRFRVNPDIPSIEPVFRTPQDAIPYQPARHVQAMTDSARLRTAKVIRVGFGDHHATIWAERDAAVLALEIQIKPKRAEWTLRGPLELDAAVTPPSIDDREPVAVQWPTLDAEKVWSRAATLEVLLNRTVKGIKCTEEYIYLYADGLNPFAFTKLCTSDPNGALLWWSADDP